jgi:hypothetical protein
MNIENRKEFGIEWKCRYGLAIMEWCRRCLFETLCQFEKNQEYLNSNKTEWHEK